MAKHTLKTLRREQSKIFKVSLAIYQHYAWKSSYGKKWLNVPYEGNYVEKGTK